VQGIRLHPSDHAARIYYAIHGAAAPGVSITIDGGKTWSVIAPRHHAYELLIEGKDTFLCGHTVEEADMWGIFQSMDRGETWAEVHRDVQVTTAARSRVRGGLFWLGSSKGRLLQSPMSQQKRDEYIPVGPEKEAEWSSIFSVLGGKQDVETAFAYDPYVQGLIASRDNFKTWRAENKGLFVGRLVKEGANVTAALTGRTFYGCINGQLYIGRTRASGEPPYISGIKVAPAVMQWTKGVPLQISLKAVFPDDDPKAKGRSVSVNLGPLKTAGKFELFDDGKHNDGAANDNVFSGTMAIAEDPFPEIGTPAKRLRPPGQILLTVVAQARRSTSELVPFSIFPKPVKQVFWNGDESRWGGRLMDARRGVRLQHFDDQNGAIDEVESNARSGKMCLHVQSARGPWLTGWGQDHQGRNLTSVDYLSFWIKGAEASTRDIKVVLNDAPGGERDANLSREVWLIKDGYLKSLTAEYQQVRIPIAALTSPTGFAIDNVGGIGFGGSDAKGHSFFVDDIELDVDGK
jgi:hypothetical protein